MVDKRLSPCTPHPPLLSPENCGWELRDESYRIKWFDGKVAPKSIDVICGTDDDDLDDYDDVEGMSCLFFLLCT